MDLVLGIVLIVLALVLGVFGGYFVLQFLHFPPKNKKDKIGNNSKNPNL